MSTLPQLCLRTKHKTIDRHKRTPDLDSCPQRRAQCLKVTVRKPKKPNSAQRKIARVQLSKGARRIWVYIPGIGHGLQQHSWVLIRGGRVRDLPGIKYKAIRGKLDFSVETSVARGSKRSKYGFKKKTKKD